MIRCIDMFSGIGGFRYGLEKTNISNLKGGEDRQTSPSTIKQSEGWGLQPVYRCVWANDNDRYACQIYRKHFGEVCEGDIRTVDVDAIPEHDLLCAGFPCQSFSIAGKRRGFEDTRGTLFFEICRVIRAKRPGYLLLENVKGLLSHDEGETFKTIIYSLDELGYDCQWQVLNSKDFGVPQNRERVFIVGHTRGKPRPKVFPIGEADEVYPETDRERIVTSPITTENAHQFGKNVTWKQARDISTAIDANYGKGWLDHGQRTMIAQGINQPSRGIEPRKDGLAATLKSGQSGTQRPHMLEIANALDADGYLRTGARPRDKDGKPQLLPIGYRRIRRLTPLECERLQGFPDGWTEGISDTQRYKCLGNAVTVNVIEAIGRQMIGELVDKE